MLKSFWGWNLLEAIEEWRKDARSDDQSGLSRACFVQL